jgi:protease I
MKRKILMIIAPVDFMDDEYLIPKKVFEEEGFVVKTMSKFVDIAKGKLGTEVKVDLKLGKDVVEAKYYDALVFVGGPGCLIYENDDNINKIIFDFEKEKKIIGAICISPRILLASGILEGKKATIWNHDDKQGKYLEEGGAIYTGKRVEVDENIVTANGPKAAKEFADKIVDLLI